MTDHLIIESERENSMDARLGDLLPAVEYATALIEKQAAVVEAARKLVGAEPGSLPHMAGTNDLKRALAELDREFAQG
ncbi:MAG: hypothetical protein KBF47_18550 [Gemmatimonadales bacterium]|nr:hypothetical protein [Gemmatimonadales bacterium]